MSVKLFYERGLALHRANRLEDAIASYNSALALKPDFAPACYDRGIALWSLGRLEEGLASTERAARIDPRYFEAVYNRGVMLQRLHRAKEALASFDTALILRPDFVEALNNRSGALQELGRFEEALASCDRALALEPRRAGFHHNRGTVLEFLGRQEESLASFEKALALDPRHPDALSSVAGRALHLCDWARVAKITGPLTASVAEGRSVVAPLIFLGYSDDPALQRRCAETYIQDRIRVTPPPLWQGERYAHDKIRLAYLSADFHQHATAYLTAELFERHDRGRFELHAVSFGEDDGSPMRARLVKAFDHFHDVSRTGDLEAATLLKSLEIDIAIDLKGHTQDSRPEILSHRPAPVQVQYLGYPGTMAVDFIDYVIADAVVLPMDQQPFYAEKIVQLPGCYQVNDSRRAIAEITSHPAQNWACRRPVLSSAASTIAGRSPGRCSMSGCDCCSRCRAACCGCWATMMRPHIIYPRKPCPMGSTPGGSSLPPAWPYPSIWPATRGPTCSWTLSRSMPTPRPAMPSGPVCLSSPVPAAPLSAGWRPAFWRRLVLANWRPKPCPTMKLWP